MNEIFELLTELSIDPFLNEAFIRDAKGILLQAGLSPEDPGALVRVAGGGDGMTLAKGAWQRCALLVDPGFDPIEDRDPPSCTV